MCGQASIFLGDVSGIRDEKVQLPVILSVDTDCVALLLRLEYDPACLISGAAHQGPLMTSVHAIDTHSPEAGRVNIVVYSYQQFEPFTEKEGTVALLDFTIKPEAPPGNTFVWLTATGAPDLPVSELVNSQGNVLVPEVFSGTINVQTGTMASTWTLY